MLGHRTETGVMRLTLEHLFQSAMGKAKFLVSFVELYNEEIRDLLGEGNTMMHVDHGGVGGLELREDPARGATIAGVKEIIVNDVDAVMALLHRGNERRTQEPTQANSESSRSHAILQISVVSSDMLPMRDVKSSRTRLADHHHHHHAKPIRVQRSSKLSMIDLAGSERAAETNNRGIRLTEGARINRSLLALGNVINALRKNDGARYVNFRDSKLTRLLKDSLGGNCRTLMLAHASPAKSSFEETINTLKYANRARAIKNAVKENIRRVEPMQHRTRRDVLSRNKRQKGRVRTGLNREDSESTLSDWRDGHPNMSHLKHKLKARSSKGQLQYQEQHHGPGRYDENALLTRNRLGAATDRFQKARMGILGELAQAVELRKAVQAIAGSRDFEQVVPSHETRDAEDGGRLPNLLGARKYTSRDHDQLRDDPWSRVSHALLAARERNRSNQEESPDASSAERACNHQEELRLRAQRECDQLKRALKRNLIKQRGFLETLESADGISRGAVKEHILGLIEASKDEQNALLNAEMQVVGQELERLTQLEARNPECSDVNVHEIALKKLELHVRLRNHVIRKLVNEIERRRRASSSHGRERSKRVDLNGESRLADTPCRSSRPISAVESPRRREYSDDAADILAELIDSQKVLEYVSGEEPAASLPKITQHKRLFLAANSSRHHETPPVRWRR